MVNECVVRNPFAERGRRREAFGRRKVRSGQRLAGHERRSLGAPRRASAHTANEWAGQLPKRGGRTGHSSAGANELMFKWLQAHAKPM